jgi:predicted nucleic acid-binding protein
VSRHCYDTAVLVDVLRGRPDAIRLLRAHEGEDRGTTAISACELALGSTTPERRRAALQLLESLDVLGLGAHAAWTAGEAMRELRGRGKEASLRDLLIGTISREAGYTLYTQDRRFPRLEGLHVVLV